MTRWQQFYKEEPELALVGHSNCVVRSTELFKKHMCQSILDVACGTGRESRYMASSFPFVIGADYSIAGLNLAKEKGTVNLIQSDARKLPFRDASFDGVYCYGLLHEFCGSDAPSNVEMVMKEIKRVIQSNGLLLLAVLEGDPINGDPELPKVQLFSDTMFFDAATGFDLLEYKAYNDISCTGNTFYHVHYGAFMKS